jgi:hypothetical protein
LQVIVVGISLLQLSKIDPEEIKEGVLDRRSTILLSASRAEKDTSSEKAFGVEDPGIDAIRGAAGAFGSIHRAISMRSDRRGNQSRRTTGSSLANPFADEEMVMRRRGRNGAPGALGSGPHAVGEDGVMRYELYDQPMFADEPMPCVALTL